MEQMDYVSFTPTRAKILDLGKIDGYSYIIASNGMHPVAYVELPKDHKYYVLDTAYPEMNIKVHGDLTYKGTLSLFNLPGDITFIGWDYYHYGDFTRYKDTFGSSEGDLKKWTTEEILEDVKSVVKQLKEINEQWKK